MNSAFEAREKIDRFRQCRADLEDSQVLFGVEGTDQRREQLAGLLDRTSGMGRGRFTAANICRNGTHSQVFRLRHIIHQQGHGAAISRFSDSVQVLFRWLLWQKLTWLRFQKPWQNPRWWNPPGECPLTFSQQQVSLAWQPFQDPCRCYP